MKARRCIFSLRVDGDHYCRWALGRLGRGETTLEANPICTARFFDLGWLVIGRKG
jgi:hypothetical protein